MRASWISLAASMRFLLGRQPRLTQVPPTVRTSVITARLPSSEALSAAAKAVDPEPRITRSYLSVAIHVHSCSVMPGAYTFQSSGRSRGGCGPVLECQADGRAAGAFWLHVARRLRESGTVSAQSAELGDTLVYLRDVGLG